MATRDKNPAPRPEPPAKRPERQFGLPGAVAVAVWLHANQGQAGSVRKVRSITITPRRYKDADTGEWKDASLKPSDLPALIFALEKAQDYIVANPHDGPNDEDAPLE